MAILVIGSSNTDLTVHVSSLPKPGETVLGGTFNVFQGGKGANQAVGAVRQDAEVAFCCNVGKDDYGRASIECYRKEGIDTSYVFETDKAASGVALILVDDKAENSIAVAGGANLCMTSEILERIKDWSRYDIVLTQLEIPVETVEHIGELARSHNIPFVLNPAPARKLSDSLLANVDIITPNETEVEILTGIKVVDEASAEAAARQLCAKGVKSVIITMGSKGAYVYSGGKGAMVPAFKVRAVDTTAAGDTFNGALCVALSEGKTLMESVVFASAASALSVTKQGAQPSVPHRNEVDEFLNSRS